VYQRPTILLVEDDSATRELFDYALRLSGFAVVASPAGVFRTLRKPITSDVLVTVVQQALMEPNAQAVNCNALARTRGE